jgi:hypothetical protein
MLWRWALIECQEVTTEQEVILHIAPAQPPLSSEKVHARSKQTSHIETGLEEPRRNALGHSVPTALNLLVGRPGAYWGLTVAAIDRTSYTYDPLMDSSLNTVVLLDIKLGQLVVLEGRGLFNVSQSR